MVPPLGRRVRSGQPGHRFPAQANTLGNSPIAISLGLERLHLFVARPLTVQSGLLLTLHPRVRRSGEMARRSVSSRHVDAVSAARSRVGSWS